MTKNQDTSNNSKPHSLAGGDARTPAACWNKSERELIRRTVAADATDAEFEHFLYVAGQTGLNPLLKQIHLVVRGSNGSKRHTTIQTGIDGYRVIADRSGEYAGSDEPGFRYARQAAEKPTAESDSTRTGFPYSATVTVYRRVQGERVAFTATAFWDEYVQTTPGGGVSDFWRRMPHGQLAKCAEALALRKAFPADLSGLYTDDEMQQAASTPPAPGQRSPAGTKNGRSKCGDRQLSSVVVSNDIAALETLLMGASDDFAAQVATVRRRKCGKTDLREASLAGLRNYRDYLQRRVGQQQTGATPN